MPKTPRACAYCSSEATKTFMVPTFLGKKQAAEVCDRHHILLSVKHPEKESTS